MVDDHVSAVVSGSFARSRLPVTALLLMGMGSSEAAMAQATVATSMTSAERAQIEQQLNDLNRMRGEFDARIRALESRLGVAAAPSAPSAAVPPVATAVTAAVPVQVAARTPPTDGAARPSFEIYGHVMADMIQDFDRVDPDWEGTFRPSRIPTVAGAFGSPGQTTMSVRQTRFGILGKSETAGKQTSFRFEFDMFGVGPDAGKTTIRLRHAYVEWGQLLVGQTTTLFQDVDSFPKIVDYWGPAGLISIRNPQLRYTFIDDGHLKAAVAIERPSEVIDASGVRLIDPNLAANLRADEKLPDLSAQLRYKDANGHVQLGGVVRRIGYDTVGAPGGQPRGSVIGWGAQLSGSAKLGIATFRGGIAYGHGIGNYMNDGGTDLAPTQKFVVAPLPVLGSAPVGSLAPEALPLLGMSAYVDLKWTKTLTTAVGYSRTEAYNTNLQLGSAIHYGEYASINLLWNPNPSFLTGPELLWGARSNKDGSRGTATRIQYSVKYMFNTGNILNH